jgi:hypothetical protein
LAAGLGFGQGAQGFGGEGFECVSGRVRHGAAPWHCRGYSIGRR